MLAMLTYWKTGKTVQTFDLMMAVDEMPQDHQIN